MNVGWSRLEVASRPYRLLLLGIALGATVTALAPTTISIISGTDSGHRPLATIPAHMTVLPPLGPQTEMSIQWPKTINSGGSGTVTASLKGGGQFGQYGEPFKVSGGTSVAFDLIETLSIHLTSAAFDVVPAQPEEPRHSDQGGAWGWSLSPREGRTGKQDVLVTIEGEDSSGNRTTLRQLRFPVRIADNDWPIGPSWLDDLPVEFVVAVFLTVTGVVFGSAGFLFREVVLKRFRSLRTASGLD
jgi:hypothetical protein